MQFAKYTILSMRHAAYIMNIYHSFIHNIYFYCHGAGLVMVWFSIFLLFDQRRTKRQDRETDGGEKKKTEKKRRSSMRRRDSDYDREASKPINHFFRQERATQTMNRYCKVRKHLYHIYIITPTKLSKNIISKGDILLPPLVDC